VGEWEKGRVGGYSIISYKMIGSLVLNDNENQNEEAKERMVSIIPFAKVETKVAGDKY
jgi:hypothetical protein